MNTFAADLSEALADLRRREKGYAAAILESSRLGELGAGDYYMLRIRNGMLLPEPEWEVLKYIFENFPTDSLIVEIGSGWGQLLTMAAARGYSAIGIDVAAGRLEGGRFLLNLIDADFPGAGNRVDFAQADFPAKWRNTLDSAVAKDRRPVIGFFSNLGYGATEEYCEACLAELHHFDYVIMDLVRFFANRIDEATQATFIKKMESLGIHYQADIFNRPGAYRFIVLSVADAAPLRPRIVGEVVQPAALLDLRDGPVSPVRSTVDIVTEPSPSAKFDRIVRVKEDATKNNSHEIRLTAQRAASGGLHTLSAALRAGERSQACIVLHHQWRDQLKIMMNVGTGASFVEQLTGETFRLCDLKIAKNGGWVCLQAGIDIAGQPEAVGLSIHVVDQDGKYYYDGDGSSTIDVGVLRLERTTTPCTPAA